MRKRTLGIAAVAGLAVLAAASAEAAEVNVYSYRQPFLVEPLFKAFRDKTGIEANVVFARQGLIERLKSEGAASPADLIFTVDIGRLHDAMKAGVVEPVKTDALAANIPCLAPGPGRRLVRADDPHAPLLRLEGPRAGRRHLDL